MEKMLKITSDVENLRIVEKFIDEISSELQLSNEIYGNLLIATLEAVNNAIVHGNKLNAEKHVEINIKNLVNKLEITVQDQGTGFDYNNIPDPTAPENIEKINGRGIFLMKKLSDGIEFFQNGKIVKLLFNTVL